jgi:beta-phosphoglucomutase-like phosphatase (HAD superfamily)
LDEFLVKYANVPKAVASNAEPANIDFVLDRYGLRQYFPVAVSGFEVERPKPFPDIYLKAAERLGARPADVIVFEDSLTGLRAAVDAGMRVVGVETTSDDLPGAVLQIKDFSDPKLEEWLAGEMRR